MRFSLPRLPQSAVVCISVYLLLVCVFFIRSPIDPGSVRISRSSAPAWQPVKLPHFTSTVKGHFSLRFILRNGWLSPSRYRFSTDDRLECISVNGIRLHDGRLPYSHWERPLEIDLEPLLVPGENVVVVMARNSDGPGGIDVRPLRDNALYTALPLALAGLLGLLVFLVSHFQPPPLLITLLVLLCGCAVRILYFLNTGYEVRSHDVQAHIENVNYVISHHAIMPERLGWESHQPPLYYIFGAALIEAASVLSGTKVADWERLQGASLLFSCLTLLVTAWIGALAFPKSPPRQWLLLGMVAFLPGIVFFSARISNDVPQQLCSAIVIALMLRWWREVRKKDFFCLALSIAAGILVKLGELIWLPCSALLIWLRPGLSRLKKLWLSLAGLAVVGALTHWYAVFRIFGEGSAGLVSSSHPMPPALALQNQLRNFVTFNPVQVLINTFNDPWGHGARREFFWEYLFRSAYFGEFAFNTVAPLLCRLLLLSGLLVLMFSWGGLLAALADLKERLPVLLIGAALTGGIVFYRYMHAFSANQDFRFISLIAIPVGILAIDGIDACRNWLKIPGLLLFLLHMLLCAWFLLALCLT